MKILGIESSCDETAASVVENGRIMLSNVINSQIDIHKKFGGVVPEIASRNHVLAIESVVNEALETAGETLDSIDAIAVTYGAGLVGALLVGVSYAKALAYATGKPLIAVSHIDGHIAGNYISHKDLKPPYLCLVVSGGHTALVNMKDYLTHELIGTTVDDAVGEAFDKVARILGLSYPGGVNIDRLAKTGKNTIAFPVSFRGEKHYNFSYSGLKTAVINHVHNIKQKGETVIIEDICRSFQESAIDILIEKTLRAAREYKLGTIVLAGGVAANSYLRECFSSQNEFKVYFPSLALCTDNAAMIAAMGYYMYSGGKGIAGLDLNACPTVAL